MTKHLAIIISFLTLFSVSILLPGQQDNQISQVSDTEVDSLLSLISNLQVSIDSVEKVLDGKDAEYINPDLTEIEVDSMRMELSAMEDSAKTMKKTLTDNNVRITRKVISKIKNRSMNIFMQVSKIAKKAAGIDLVNDDLYNSLRKREGTLNTNDISITLRGLNLIIKLTPIDDEVLQYCSPDVRKTFQSLRQKQEDLQEYYPDTDLRMFYVIFQADEDRTRYEPDEIEIEHQGDIFKPIDILPLSGDFDLSVLEKKYLSVAQAIYLFDSSIDYFDPLRFFYRNEIESNRWNEVIRRLDNEKRRYKAASQTAN